MTQQLALEESSFETRAVSPFREMGAYEVLWVQARCDIHILGETVRRSDLEAFRRTSVAPEEAHDCAAFVTKRFEQAEINRFGVRVHGAGEYPSKLRDAASPVELLYYQGWWDLAASPSVAVVGTRKPSREGVVAHATPCARVGEGRFYCRLRPCRRS